MISTSIVSAVNDQIRHEISSAYLYLSMAAHCESQNLPGFARWLRLQWEEELGHAMRLFDMVHSRGGRVTLGQIDKPQTEFTTVADVFTQVLQHERKVTASINQLYALALKESDYATQVELQWFIKEQTEEERTAEEILVQVKMVGDSPSLLLMLDRQLGARGAGK